MLLVCRKVKPKPTTVTHTWLAVNAQDTFFRITSTGAAKQSLVVAHTLGLRTHTAGFTISKWHTHNQTRNKFGQTDIHTDRQTDRHTMFFVGRGGDSAGIVMPPPLPRLGKARQSR